MKTAPPQTTTQKPILTIKAIKDRKGGSKLGCLTAYTTPLAKILSPHCDILLVGDSLGTVVYGLKTTQGVTLDMMINHGKAVRRGAPETFIVIDMPYGTYDTPDQAIKTARQLMQETGCQAVKLEGGVSMATTIQHLSDHDIPVMAHVGLLPQSVDENGTYRITGKKEEEAATLMQDARAVQDAGAFAVVLEGMIEPVAHAITDTLNIPTIGIGASPACDGQILVTDDMLGLNGDAVPKFVKHYARLDHIISEAVSHYIQEVQNNKFPSNKHIYKPK